MSGRRVLVLVVTVLPGCATSIPPDPAAYTLAIPDDIPGDVVLTDKDGVEHAVNGRDLYARNHRDGWRTCWERYQRGRVAPGDEAAWERYVRQDYVIAARGFADGFKQRQALLPR